MEFAQRLVLLARTDGKLFFVIPVGQGFGAEQSQAHLVTRPWYSMRSFDTKEETSDDIQNNV
jgi:hypothetical protein